MSSPYRLLEIVEREKAKHVSARENQLPRDFYETSTREQKKRTSRGKLAER